MSKENLSRASLIRYPVEAVQVLCRRLASRPDKHNFREIMHANSRFDVRYHFRDIAELIQFTGGFDFDQPCWSAPFPNTALFGPTNACDGHMRYAGMAMPILLSNTSSERTLSSARSFSASIG